jgi:arginine/lysine/ornithine decarboxylase
MEQVIFDAVNAAVTTAVKEVIPIAIKNAISEAVNTAISTSVNTTLVAAIDQAVAEKVKEIEKAVDKKIDRITKAAKLEAKVYAVRPRSHSMAYIQEGKLTHRGCRPRPDCRTRLCVEQRIRSMACMAGEKD